MRALSAAGAQTRSAATAGNCRVFEPAWPRRSRHGRRPARSDAQLLANIKRDLAALTTHADQCKGQWAEEDLVYRFWHRSFKLYGLQDLTLRIVGALEAIAPDARELDERFRLIVGEGTGKTFEYEHKQRWLAETRPMLEAFWHAEYMLRMAVRYGREPDEAPEFLPSGWAALLCLFGIR